MSTLEEIARDLAAKAIEGQNVIIPMSGTQGWDPIRTGRLVGDLYEEILKAVITAHKLLPK